MPRITHSSWRRLETFAFGRGEKARGLRVFVDAETLPDSPERDILLAFGHHPEVEVVGTDARFLRVLDIGQYDTQNAFTPWSVKDANGRGFHSGTPGPDIQRMGRKFANAGEEQRGERAAVMVTAAADYPADALATADPLLLDRFPRNAVAEGNPMSAAETVALLGLFLRVREDFVLDLGDGYRDTFDRTFFYLVLTRDLTPSGWRWFSACVNHHHDAQARDDTLMHTAQSAIERIDRSLRARDRLHEKLQLPPTRDLSTEALFYFDVALFMLGGAFDGLARVAHIVHGIDHPERLIGWNKDWLKKLAAANPTLAHAMTYGRPHRDARELVATLRNTIHHQTFQTVMHHAGGKVTERVVVPSSIERSLEELLDRIGDPADFGVTRERDELYIAPGVYIQCIFPIVLSTINMIMDATPVETLPGVDPAQLMTQPPNDGLFEAGLRERVRLLSGIP